MKTPMMAASAAMFLVFAQLVAAQTAAPQSGAPAAPAVIALKAAHLFDSVSGTLIEHGVVVIAGNKIQAVGAGAKIPEGAQVIDLGDATLLPGLIDAHVHLSEVSSDNWYEDFYHSIMRFPAEQALYGAHYAKATLEAGITTVRDVGSDDYIALGLRNAIKAGVIPGPRMLVSNYAMGSTGGHADQGPVPPQTIAVAGPIRGVCNGPEECREAVRYQIKYGADVIKFMPSGGVLSLSDPVDNVQLTQEEMNAIVSEAHAWNRKVAAHCHGDRAAKMAIAAGVDSIEHGSFLKDDTLAEMKKKHVYLVATLFAGVWVGERLDKFPPAIARKSARGGGAGAADVPACRQNRRAARHGYGCRRRAAWPERARIFADGEKRPGPSQGADGRHRGRRRPARHRRSDRHAAGGEIRGHRRRSRQSLEGHVGHRTSAVRHEGRRHLS